VYSNKTDLNISAQPNCAEYFDFPTSSLRSVLARTEAEVFDTHAREVTVSNRGVADGTWYRLPRRQGISLPSKHLGSLVRKARKKMAVLQNVTGAGLCDTSDRIWRYCEQSLNGY